MIIPERGNGSTRKNMSMRFEKGVLPYSLVIAAAVVMVYAGIFYVPFVFDDQVNIVENTSIRSLSSIFQVFAPPFEMGVAGRPVVNFSLALNHGISGEDPWSYHLLNLLIHLSAALCLFGIVRRTLTSDRLKEAYGNGATPLAFACAVIWAIHPVQTQAVTYTIQRCESLMGLFFLLTFYFAIRGWQSATPRPWHLAAVLSFIVGAGAKEVIAVAAVLLFVYDLLFFHDNAKNALRRSLVLYGGIAFGLVSLGFLVAAGGTASSGTGRTTFSALDYWMTQPGVILHYLRLIFWPEGFAIDYGWPITTFGEAWPSIAVIALLMAASLWALVKRNPIGFPAVFFFTVLAPTSLIPLPDAAFDHRLYLPSMAVVTITLICFYRWWARLTERRIENEALGKPVMRKGAAYLLVLVVASLGILTYARNMDYRSDVSIWADAAEKYPGNSRAHANLGNALLQAGDLKQAMGHLYEALRIETENARKVTGGLTYDEYVRIRPVYAKIQDNLGWAWLRKGDPAQATGHLREALKVNPAYATALAHMGIALYLQGKQPDAAACFQRAILMKPSDPDIRVNLGVTLRLQGRPLEAARHFQEALRLAPRHVAAHYGAGMALHELGRDAEAAGHFQEALRLNPAYGPAREIMERLENERQKKQAAS